MISRRRDARAAAWLQSLTVAAVLAAAAAGSAILWHDRLDLTRDREGTPDPAVTRMVERLPDPVTVRVVMSKDLPDAFVRIRSRLDDVLREYEARSGGRLRLVFDHPDRDSLARVGALSLGVQEVVFREEERAGVKARKGFFGLALIYRDRKEVMPVLRSVETFEYDFAVRLKRLTGTPKTVGILEGGEGGRFQVSPPAGEPVAAPGFDTQFPALRSRLEALYRLVKTTQADVLLVTAPRRLTAEETAELGRFLESGKPVIFLMPGVSVDLSAGIDPAAQDNGYAGLLARYGVSVRPGLLFDPDRAESVRFGDEPDPLPYPWWLRAEGESLNADNPVTAPLPSLSLPWVSALDVNPSAQPSARYEVLAAASERAREIDLDTVRRRTLYPSALPAYARTPVPGAPRAAPVAVLVTGPKIRILVISNALFVTDFYAGYVDIESNLQFVVNAVDYLALDPGLIGMRSRPLPDAPLDPARSERLKPWLLAFNLSAGPLALLILGAFFAARRRARERNAA